MPTKPEPTVEELASTHVKDRAEALRGLKKITAMLVGIALAASFLMAMWVGISPDLDVMTEQVKAMDVSTSSAWLCAVILAVAGAILVGHRVGERIASKVMDENRNARTRLVYGGLLVLVFAGLTPLLPLQATFLGIAASVLVAQFEPKQAGAAE